MGNDQGIRRKHKQRTVIHNKHSAFPGMVTPPDVIIQGQSIKPIIVRDYSIAPNIKSISYSHPLWVAYDLAAKKLGTLGGASAQGLRVKNEHEFTQAYRKLVRSQLAYPLKKKYCSL